MEVEPNVQSVKNGILKSIHLINNEFRLKEVKSGSK